MSWQIDQNATPNINAYLKENGYVRTVGWGSKTRHEYVSFVADPYARGFINPNVQSKLRKRQR